ncbi:MAG TPA: hypothetical protein VED17_11660 [Nitrososphaerales archaeon]|nr:hypothetical protein [Nitrososphaerales archaeon]
MLGSGSSSRWGQNIEDLAQIISFSTPSRNDRAKLEADIHRYLSKLKKPCPTPECDHGLTRGGSICRGYQTQAKIIDIEQGTHITKSHPIVIPVFCYVFSEFASQGCKEKEVCEKCREESFSYKSRFNGLFCHGCGFFLDYENRTVGYSDEWTTSSNIPSRLDVACSYCERTGVSTKFGDYWFCTPYCMQMWYLSGGSQRKSENVDDTKGNNDRISFLR